MANIAFIKTPPALSLAGNKILVTIAGKNAFTNADVKAVNKLYITGQHYFVVNESVAPPEIPFLYDGRIRNGFNNWEIINVGYLQFSWSINKVFLYCYSNSPNPIYNYPSGAPGGGDIYLIQLAAWFRQNPLLNNDFDIKYNQADSCVDFIARKIGPQYNLNFFSTNPGNVVVAESGDLSKQNLNYSIGIRPEDADGKEIVSINRPIRKYDNNGVLPADYEADKTGVTTIDLSDLVEEEITGHVSFPTPKSYGAFHALVKSIRLFAFEKFGAPPLSQGGEFSDYFYYLQGKLGNFSQGELNYLGKTFMDRIRENGVFLTFAPVEKIIDIYAPERLYFLFLTAGSYKLTVKQYYSDGTTALDYKDLFYVAQYQVRELFVSYDKVRTNAPKKLTKYEVYITNAANNIISEVRTFVLDYTFYSFARYFYFLNRLGVYECLRSTGKVSKARKINKEFANIPLPDDFTTLDKEEKQISADITTTYEINSGFFTDKYWADYFQEFLLSPDVYWLKRGNAYPVSIQEGKQDVVEDGIYSQSANFNLTHSLHDDFTEEFSAQEPIQVGDFNVDFNTDYFTGETHDLYEIVLDELFDIWIDGLPANWTKQGDGVITNDLGRCKIASATGATTALFYPSSFMTNVNYKLSFKVDFITPKTLLIIRAAGFDCPILNAAGEYSHSFKFTSLRALNHAFTVQLAAYPGTTNVNAIISNIKLEYEYFELENALIDDNFDLWEPDSSIPMPLGWTVYGAWNLSNFISNDQGRFRITLADNASGFYSLSHNFKFEAGHRYKFTISFPEITNSLVRLYVGNTDLAWINEAGILEYTFEPTLDFYSFDLRFEINAGARTIMIDNFKLEKL